MQDSNFNRPFTQEEYITASNEFKTKGYTIYHNVLPPEICSELSNEILEQSFNLLFRDIPENERPDYKDPTNYRLLVDSNYRRERNIPNTTIWLNGNTRKPIWSKNNGMINIYYIRKLHKYLHFNPQIFLLIANLYGHNQIGFTRGTDRVSFKVNGSVDMPTHLDYNLFNDKINFDPVRVQSFFNCSVPSTNEVSVRDSGTIQVIPYFHHYWEIAQRYFVSDGLHPLSNEEYAKITQPLGKQFNKELPAFNTFLHHLHLYAENRLPSNHITEEIISYNDLLNTLPLEYHELKWTPIELRAGDLMCWNHKLPHGSLRNRSNTPRIVSYLAFFPFPSKDRGYNYDWKDSDRQKELLEELPLGISSQQGTNRDNELEREYLRPKDFNYVYIPTEKSEFYSTIEEYRNYCLMLQGY